MDTCGIAGNADLSSSTNKKHVKIFSKNVKIGVLGGIGPEATAEFYSKLIKALQKRGLIKSNADYPQIIINSIPAPELIHRKISDTDIKPYAEGLKFLEKSGADFIVMVCNTIHLYYDTLQKKIKTPILDLRQEVKQILVKSGIKSALVLGTPAAIKLGLCRFKGIKTFEPSQEEMKQITGVIFNFNKGIDKKHHRRFSRIYVEQIPVA